MDVQYVTKGKADVALTTGITGIIGTVGTGLGLLAGGATHIKAKVGYIVCLIVLQMALLPSHP